MYSHGRCNLPPESPRIRRRRNQVHEWWSAPSSKKFLMSPAGNARRKRLPALADIVAKVFLGWRRKILRAADAFYARRRCFIQNRSRASVVALKSDAAAKIDFREIFRAVRFSTFATISARLRHADRLGKCLFLGGDRK